MSRVGKNRMKYGKGGREVANSLLGETFYVDRARAASIVGTRCREATFCRVSAIRFESRNTEVCRVHGSLDNYGVLR